MSYYYWKISKERLEKDIKSSLKELSSCCSDTNGYASKKYVYRRIIAFAFVQEAWNEKLDRPATNYTPCDNIGFRYHLYSATKQEVIYNPMKEEEANAICEKIIESMVKKGLVRISKSGKAVKYIGD